MRNPRQARGLRLAARPERGAGAIDAGAASERSALLFGVYCGPAPGADGRPGRVLTC